jgi:hypothetical protein
MSLLAELLIILPAVFLAGVVDSIAGGGGLLSIPAYLAAGLPPHLVLGTNKLSAAPGTLLATWRYLRRGLVDRPVALCSAACALFGSYAGTRTVLRIGPGFLRYLLLVLIPLLTLFTLVQKNLGVRNDAARIKPWPKFLLAAAIGFVFGFYDGFFGPGTGTFLIVAYTLAMRYDLAMANGNTKLVNLASNLASLATFLLHGQVLLVVGLPAVLAGIAGNAVGSSLVIRRGSRVIRPVFLLALGLLFTKILIDLLRGK